MLRQADDDLALGGFLFRHLGAERYLRPELAAMLMTLRRRLIVEHRATTTAELLLIDSALISWHHTLRVNSWVGNFALLIEEEFFGSQGPRAKLKKNYGYQVAGLKVENMLHRFGEELLPSLDRLNRLMLRNLKALRERRQDAVPSVTLGAAQQVNVGGQQVNVAEAPDGEPRAGA
jgi:hypothetical protein